MSARQLQSSSDQELVSRGDYPLILHLIPSLNIGGTEKQLVQFINRSSNPPGHMVVTFDDVGELSGELPIPPKQIGPFGRRPSAYPANVATVLQLRRLIAGQSIDLVHAHLGVSQVLAALATPRRVPLVASRRGRNLGFEQAPLLRLVEGLAHRRIDILLCNSNYLSEYVRQHDLWAPRIRVIHNAVDLASFNPVALPKLSPPTIVSIANLRAPKRQSLLLQALQILSRQLPTTRAVFVGDGPERPMLERMSASLGISANVEFVGHTLDVAPFIARAHVSALTSSSEGFPNALLESMAMGRPVVATRVGGIPELVRHQKDGLLVASTPESVAKALSELLTQPARLRSMGAEAAKRAKQFTWDRLVRETESTYSELLAGSGPRPTTEGGR